MAADLVLSIRDLVVEYPSAEGRWHPVVDGVSIEVGRGERVGLVGESGSGKSVAALAALGLAVQPGRIRDGRITVAGVDLATASEARLRRVRGSEIGFIFQESSAALNPVLTVGYQIAEAVCAHREVTGLEARAVARQLLHDVALEGAADILSAAPHQLSGGQLQRVMIALALAGQPRLLIADEPTTALDLATQAQILELLHRLTAADTALLLISHDLAVVAGMVDRVLVLYAGQVVEEAPTGDLYQRPLHPYTRLLLDVLHGRSTGAPSGSAPSPVPADSGCRFAPRCRLAEPGCRTRAPELTEIEGGRKIRCPIVNRGLEDDGRPSGADDG